MNNSKLISKRIGKLVNNYDNFKLNEEHLRYIHKCIFGGIFDKAGIYRCINLSRAEDVLNGKSVLYAIFYNIDRYLVFDFDDEITKNYSLMNSDEVINSISDFTIRLWSTHPFHDGNTRTISVFIRQYLKKMGFSIDDSLFVSNFDYFRNSLVRAVYSDYSVSADDSYLRLFYEKLLFNDDILLDESSLYINNLFIKKKIRK